AVELNVQSNQYCHAQKDFVSHPDPKSSNIFGGNLTQTLAIMPDTAHLLAGFSNMLFLSLGLFTSSHQDRDLSLFIMRSKGHIDQHTVAVEHHNGVDTSSF
ncbi:hypothetical protein A6R68_10180, partial [Neotoma lepida]